MFAVATCVISFAAAGRGVLQYIGLAFLTSIH